MILFAIWLIFVYSFTKNGKELVTFILCFCSCFNLRYCVILILLSLLLCAVALYHWLRLCDLSLSVFEPFCFLSLSITPCPFTSVCLVPLGSPHLILCLLVYLSFYVILSVSLSVFLSFSLRVFYFLSLSMSCWGGYHFPRWWNLAWCCTPWLEPWPLPDVLTYVTTSRIPRSFSLCFSFPFSYVKFNSHMIV